MMNLNLLTPIEGKKKRKMYNDLSLRHSKTKSGIKTTVAISKNMAELAGFAPDDRLELNRAENAAGELLLVITRSDTGYLARDNGADHLILQAPKEAATLPEVERERNLIFAFPGQIAIKTKKERAA